MMNTFLWSCAALWTLFVTGEALSCYTCDVGILGACLHQTPVNCTDAQDRCYVAVAKFTCSDLLDLHQRGCTQESDCGNSNGTILTVDYSITRTCCSTSLCNAATSSPQLPLGAALGAAMGAALVVVWGL